MATFEYTALDDSGRQRQGVVDADSGRQVRQLLRDQGLAPMSVAAAGTGRQNGAAGRVALPLLRHRWRTLSALELALFMRQLATLIAAGLPVDESLHTIARQAESRRLASLFMTVRGRVLEGHSFAAALGEYPAAFGPMYRSTVAAGEQSGYLHVVLDNLADHAEQRFESARNIQMAMLYPTLLFVLLVATFAGLFVFVVPEMVETLTALGQQLPLLTRALIAISDFLRSTWWLLAGLALIGYGAGRWLLRKPELRLRWDRRALSLPIVGRFARGANAARYASTLAILTSSGVSLVEAMHIAAEVVTNRSMKQHLGEARQKVTEGASLRIALERTGDFPPMFLHMIASGEASGELAAMLAKVADYQQKELTRTATTLVQLLQPLMLLFMAGLVLIVVLATLVPILSMNQLG